jgi:hypothetical protein
LTPAPKLIVRHGTDVLATTPYPAGIREDRMAVPQRRFITLWWLYLAGLVALFGITLFNYVLEGFFSTFLGMVVTWAFLSFDLLCMAGLYAYVKSLALFTKTFWRTLVVLLALRISLLVPLFAVQLRPWDGTSEQYVAIFTLVSLLYCIPMLWALWSYAFRCPHFWAAVPLR